MVPLMKNKGATMPTSYDPSVGTAKNDANGDAPILAWEVDLASQNELWLGRVGATASGKTNVKHENRLMESHLTSDEYGIAREVK